MDKARQMFRGVQFFLQMYNNQKPKEKPRTWHKLAHKKVPKKGHKAKYN